MGFPRVATLQALLQCGFCTTGPPLQGCTGSRYGLLPHHELFSTGPSSCPGLALVGALCGLQPPSGHTHLQQCGVLCGLHVEICSARCPWAAGGQPRHHGPLMGREFLLCTSSTSCPLPVLTSVPAVLFFTFLTPLYQLLCSSFFLSL